MSNLKIKTNLSLTLIILLVNYGREVTLYPAHDSFSQCNCVLLQSCESFNKFIVNSVSDLHIQATIQKAVCYFDGFNIFVCCPMKLNRKRYVKEKPNLNYLDELTGLNCPPSFGEEYSYDEYLRTHQHIHPKNYDDHHHRDSHIFCKEYGNCDNTFVFPHANDHGTHYNTFQHYPAYHHHDEHDKHNHDHHHHFGHGTGVPFFPHSAETYNPVQPTERITPKPTVGLSNKCGMLSSSSSSTGNIGVYPWITRLAYLNTTSRTIRYRCMGTIITEQHILTAAHCVDQLVRELRLIYVRAGDDTNFDDFQVLETIVHPKYNEPLFNNDVAILRLARTSQANGPLIRVCLPQNNSLTEDTGIVAGWSNSGSLTPKNATIRYINLPIMNNTECAIRYAKYSENFETSIVITPTEFCAQAQAMNDVCEGDSGGPFMERSNAGRYTLLGIVAFGPKTNCGQSNLPGVYMRISSYVDWILTNVK